MLGRRVRFSSPFVARSGGRPEAPRRIEDGTAELRPRAPRTRARLLALIAFGVAAVAVYESRTSAIEAWILSRYAAEATYTIDSGPNPHARYPGGGPFDRRAGYPRIGEFRERLEARGFVTTEQARFSSTLTWLTRRGISPPFRHTSGVGLVIRDRGGVEIFDFDRERPRFARFDDIPLVIVRSLLFIEDRGLAEGYDSRRNPVVDWSRLVAGGTRHVGRKFGLPLRKEGGSTLATQMEKYLHSPGGRTDSAMEKLRQMTSASLRVYREGPDTSVERTQIVLDYLNSIPLAAAPGYGEVSGLGEGLRVWFGLELADVQRDLETPGYSEAKALSLKHALALIYAVRSPTTLLIRDRTGLAARVDTTLQRLGDAGVVDGELVERALAVPLQFASGPPPVRSPALAEGKAVAAVRGRIAGLLAVPDFYTLDRLHLAVDTTIDAALQQRTVALFRRLADPEFVAANGLRGPRMLDTGDPAAVTYSLLLVEATGEANEVRVHADNLSQPFDVNSGMKMELGSTAKLRTLVHYLDVCAGLYGELGDLPVDDLRGLDDTRHDPLTRWAARTLSQVPGIDLETFLERALDRRYSASPTESFFTGGGLHRFHNFDSADDGLVLSVREGTVRSCNLVFIRLMRDLVRYHTARLPYDARPVLDNIQDPERERMLQEIAEQEGQQALRDAWSRFHGQAQGEVVSRLLGRRAGSDRRLAVLYYAWHPEGDAEGLADWLAERGVPVSAARTRELARAVGSKRHSLSDYAWLADVKPLDLWCAGRVVAEPSASFGELVAASVGARANASAWLFKTRNRHAQDQRLRIRIERDAFERMATAWRRAGFPFERLVPSFASAIGSSADRPTALAELMGILVNDGVRRATISIRELRLAPGTPYYAAMSAEPLDGEQVVPVEVARALRGVLGGVVESGTARRLSGTFVTPGGVRLAAGGKTGSGDNRLHGTGEATSRTAAFVFYVGDRYFGVITASVGGPASGSYRFTSSLPLAVLRQLAPEIAERAAAVRPS